MDSRFDGMDGRFDRMDARFDRIDARFDGNDDRFDSLESHLGALENVTITGFANVNARLDHPIEFSGERWRDHEDRIRDLEKKKPNDDEDD